MYVGRGDTGSGCWGHTQAEDAGRHRLWLYFKCFETILLKVTCPVGDDKVTDMPYLSGVMHVSSGYKHR